MTHGNVKRRPGARLVLRRLAVVGIVVGGVVTAAGLQLRADSGMTVTAGQAAQGAHAAHAMLPCTPGSMGAMGPCIDEDFIPPARPGYGTVRLTAKPPVTSNTGEPAAFRHRCDFSHMNFDDPILYPGQPGSAHLHAFFGNTGSSAASTSNSLRTTGNSTCAGGIFNRSAYWVPAMIDTSNGRPITPNDNRSQYHSDLEVYYKLGYQGVGHLDVQPWPSGLQIIAGNLASSTTETQWSRVKYWCEDENGRGPESAGIPTCTQGEVLTMYIEFHPRHRPVTVTGISGAARRSPATPWCPS